MCRAVYPSRAKLAIAGQAPLGGSIRQSRVERSQIQVARARRLQISLGREVQFALFGGAGN